ncbi:MAG: BamA/TamA family outer membrane protein [Gemmatimonadetes bacterium]|nr:BamA/TamA family outer membrane protein [Gemmatimonadota bacterium]
MKHSWAALLIAVLVPSSLHAQDASDAFLDEDARELVRLARVRISTVDRRIESYQTTARERSSVTLRAGIAEKLIYRRETVTRIDWQRDGPTQLDVLALREVAPLFDAVPDVPDDLSSELPRLAFDPADPGMLMRIDTTGLRHPLAEGAERHYRFASGDTTIIGLPDGRTVRLRELRIIPRRRHPRLINGSFWLDTDTHAVVQAYFRLARGFDADEQRGSSATVSVVAEDTASSRRRSIDLTQLGILKPLRADLEYIALEYGLWDLQWWLPRLVTARGFAQVNRFRIPFAYERTYDGYTVTGNADGALAEVTDSLPRRCRPVLRFPISPGNAARDSARQAQADTTRARQKRAEERRRIARNDSTPVIQDCERETIITAVPDSLLLNSPELPPSIYAGDTELIPDATLRGIADRVRSIPEAPWQFLTPRLQFGLRGPGLVRYNRVEGLSVGARMNFDMGPATLATEARIGVADLDPRGEVALDRRGGRLNSRLGVYRRLHSATPAEHSMFASLGALLLGRDDGQYYDALGSELIMRPRDSRTQWYDVRLYAERQRAVERNTDFSVAHLIDSGRVFRENFTADDADQVGARIRLRAAAGRNPAAPRIAGELSLTGETGDYRIVRPEALLRFNTPLVAGVALELEGAAGTNEGAIVPAQANWYLGGASSLRGYPGGALSGERYWRARGELGWGVTGARLALFTDAGWTAPRNRFDIDGTLLSAGIGASLLDGVFRIDLAHGFDKPGGLRLHVHFRGLD